MSAPPGESGRRGPGRIALAWALATFAALAALQGAPGVSRDEAAVVAAAGRGAGALRGAAPPLVPVLAGATHAVGATAGLSHLRAFRLGSALAGALLSLLLAHAAGLLAGPAAALLAPALFWLAPRTLHAGLVATPDLALAALALAAVLAWRRVTLAGRLPGRVRAGALAGLLAGAAVLARPDAWTLVLVFALHALVCGVLARRAEPAAPQAEGLPAALGVAILAGAAAVLAAWPGALRAGAAPWLASPGSGLGPLLAFATVPAPLLWAFLGGLGHTCARLATVLRGRERVPAAGDDALLVLATLAALGGAALAHAPPGARPFLHALPFLALLGARALVHAAALAWPARRHAVLGALALLVLYPGLRATVHAFPHGASAWNELVGGAPGAASRGLRRQDGGEAASALLDTVNARAAPGARIWWPGVAPEALALYLRDGRLRKDLAVAEGPAEADLVVAPLDGGSRDAEYRAWSALRTARPSAGVYADDVPLVFGYARPGAWR